MASSKSLILLTVLLLVGVRSACRDGECRQLFFPAKFIIGNKRLMKHVIATVKVPDFDFCELQCYHQPNCVSINIKVIPDSRGLYECELNNVTHRGHDNKLMNRDGYVYKGAETACDRVACENGGTCQSGFTDKGYRCICPPDFSSAHCEKGCPEHWVVHNHSCYYMTGERASKLNDAQEKCRIMSAKLPIIKSESENTFILGLMSRQRDWTWLGMRKKKRKMVWLDGSPAESSDGAFSAWKVNEPSKKGNEGCAYLNFHEKTWNDDKCNYGKNPAPYVLCQRKLKRNGS
ncbi:brevican core protein-like isoform X1 [Acropora muricata]|uniref:brevican core protein-like isoform X1 n=1 Tax=Acropora muricata TaxID=159855 RepID=UPI0034E3D7FA